MRKVTIHPSGTSFVAGDGQVKGQGNTEMAALIGWLAQNGIVVEQLDFDPRVGQVLVKT